MFRSSNTSGGLRTKFPSRYMVTSLFLDTLIYNQIILKEFEKSQIANISCEK